MSAHSWISRWLERRRSRRVVSWESCEMNIPAWRQKKAEEEWIRRRVEAQMVLVRANIDMNMREADIFLGRRVPRPWEKP